MVWLMFVAAMAVAVWSLVSFRRTAHRNAALRKVAAANGYTYVEEDLFASSRVPFQILRLGNRDHVENVLLGTAADGAPVRVFDHLSWTEKQGQDGTQRTGYRRLTCCLTETASNFPHLVVQPETTATRLLQKVGMPAIDLESEAFNRMFHVTSEDERFARMFLDPQVMDLLLTTKGQLQFEVLGRWVLVAGPLVPARHVLGLVGLSTRFRSVIPPVVRAHHPDLPDIVEGGHR